MRRTIIQACRILICSLFMVLAPVASYAQDEGEDDERPLRPGHRDVVLKMAVNKAVGAGLEWLDKRQEPDGGWECAWARRDPPGRLPAAETGLALLVFMSGGRTGEDESMARGFNRLRLAPLSSIVETALTLMALEVRSRRDESGRRVIAPPDRDWMKECVEFLLRNRASSGRLLAVAPEQARQVKDVWARPWGTPDHESTFFALLGLRSAARCGIEVPREVWLSALDHFLEAQERSGPGVHRIQMIEDREHGYVAFKSASPRPDRARGWCSGAALPPRGEPSGQPDSVSGAMTCAGISSVAICLSELGRGCPTLFEMFGRMALRDGIARVTTDLSRPDAKNPLSSGSNGVFSLLYALQCAGELTSQRNFNQHDWYREGAEFLLKNQRKNGSWDDEDSPAPVSNTCFALLFLSRATRPGKVILK
jgi:hypothetical protein